MADDKVDVQRLVVSLEANTKKYENALQKVLQQTTAVTSGIDRLMKQPGASFGVMAMQLARPIRMNLPHAELGKFKSELLSLRAPEGLNFEHLKAGLSGLVAAFGLDEIRKLSDQWTEVRNRIASAGVEASKIPIVLEQVASISERSRISLEQAATVYSSMTRAAREFGASQASVATVTETVTKALATSGATRQQIEGSLVDLTQGMQRGVLQGQELRALLGEVPAIAQAIAKEFGVSVGQVKALGEEGKLTAERVFKAIEKAAPAINDVFASTKPTMEQAFTTLETAATRYVGTSGTISTATAATTSLIQGLGHNFGTVADGAGALGLIIATRLVSKGMTPMVESFGAAARAALMAAPAFNGVNVAIGAAAVQAQAGSLALRGLSGVLALIGGPVGAVILGTTAAIGYMAVQSQRAQEAAALYAKSLDQIKHSSDAARYGVKGLGDAIQATGQISQDEAINNYHKSIDQADATTQGLETTLRTTAYSLGQFWATMRYGGDAAKEASGIIQKALEGDSNAALEAKAQLAALANAHPNMQGLVDDLMPLMTRLEAVRASLAKLKADFASLSAPSPWQHAPADASDRQAERNSAAIDNTLANRLLNSQGDEDYKADQRAKAIIADTKEKTGATLDYAKAVKQANAEIAAEDAKSTRKGPKTDEQKLADKIKTEITSLEEEKRKVEAETAAWNLSNTAKAIAIELSKNNVDAKSKEGQAISALVTKIQEEKAAQEKLKAAAEGMSEVKSYASNSIQTALDDIILKGDRAGDVLKNLSQAFQKAMLDGALFGDGPLGKFLGGQNGGLFGQILGGGQQTSQNQQGQQQGGLMSFFSGLFGTGQAQEKPSQTNNISVTNNVSSSGDSGGLGGIFGKLLGGIFGNLFGGGQDGGGGSGGIGQNAEGTDNWRGGLTWVGEKGPEILNIPRGAQIVPNHKIGGGSSQILQQGNIALANAQQSQNNALIAHLATVAASSGRGAPMQVVVHNNAGAAVSTQETQGQGGQRQLEIMVESVVAGSIAKNGTVAKTLQSHYGLNRGTGR